ncbi:MAG: hypothetical protein AAFY21_22920, partial [Cyanobacteria bacterium J06641_2]
SKAAELQNSTAQMISVARANIGELLKLIEQVILEYSCSIFHVIRKLTFADINFRGTSNLEFFTGQSFADWTKIRESLYI